MARDLVTAALAATVAFALAEATGLLAVLDRWAHRMGRLPLADLAVALATLAISSAVFLALRLRRANRALSRSLDAEAALRIRDATLEAVAFAAGRFLQTTSWEDCIDDVLARLGSATRVSRVYLFRNAAEDSRTVMVQLNEWQAPGVRSQVGDPAWQRVDYDAAGPRWEEQLKVGAVVTGVVDEVPAEERELVRRASPDVRSYLIVPVMAGGTWWGFVGFDECREDRRWTQAEIDALEAAAATLGAAIHRGAAEAELRAAEARYRTLAEELPAMTYIWDSSREPEVASYVSPQVETLFGYRPEDWIDDPEGWYAHVHPVDRDRLVAESGRTQATGDAFHAEYRVVARDGRHVWVRDEAIPVARDEGGRPLLWQGVVHDITARRRAEEELREAELRYRVLVEQIPAVTYATELDPRTGEVTGDYVSPQVEGILGFTQEEWHRRSSFPEERLHPEDRDRVVAVAERAEREGGSFDLEYRFVAKDGRTVWVHDHGSYVDLEPGRRLLQGVMLDITQRKRAEAEREVLLGRLVAAQEEERGRIAGEIHDDPVQKMTAVGLRLQMLRRLVDRPEQVEVLDQVDRSVELAIQRLRHLLFELRPPALDREGLAPALRQYLEDATVEAGLQAHLENRLVDEPPAETRVIAYRIAQEAITNVRKHANAERVDVLVQSRDRGVLVRIRDDGDGFDGPPRGSAEPGHYGLASMRDRAELAGGWLRLDSSPERGTSVEFWVPWSSEASETRSASLPAELIPRVAVDDPSMDDRSGSPTPGGIPG